MATNGNGSALAHVSAARRELALAVKAKDLNGVKRVKDIAARIKDLAKTQRMGLEAQNEAAEVKLRAERAMGRLLKESEQSKVAGRPKKIATTVGAISRPTLADIGVTHNESSRCQRIASLPDADFEEYVESATGEGRELTSAGALRLASGVHVANNSGNNEWYTPDEILDAARTVLGGFDLDPASSAVANKRVQAARFFTAEDDGLAQEWSGRVWLNPPYAQPLIGQFAEKLVVEWETENIDAACVLVNNATETAWGQCLGRFATAVCFPKGRIKYLTPEGGPKNTPLQGQAVFYFGPDVRKFAEVFCGYGFIMATTPLPRQRVGNRLG